MMVAASVGKPEQDASQECEQRAFACFVRAVNNDEATAQTINTKIVEDTEAFDLPPLDSHCPTFVSRWSNPSVNPRSRTARSSVEKSCVQRRIVGL
jgi:hypothetical protein